MTTTGVVMAGVPSTGKTTYLALIYHAIVEERADGLSLGRFDDDREYVNEISERLLAGERALHTQIDDEVAVSLSLQFNDHDDLRLSLPDLSGETWEHALVDRRWSNALDSAVAEAVGFMIFVHPTELNENLTLMDVAQAADLLAGADDETPEAESDDTHPPDATDTTAGEDATAPDDEQDEVRIYKQVTAVSLVELAQFFAARCGSQPIRISVVISAWDSAKEQTPAKWITKHAPLLGQFLATNTGTIEAAVFGVSAQGGDFADDARREQLLSEHPLDRAYAVGVNGDKVGLAAPLLWVLRLDP